MAPRAASKTAKTGKAKQEARREKRTLVLAGREGEQDGKFVGYDGERMRFAGTKFYFYGEKLPSWVRVQDAEGNWVNAGTEVGFRRNRGNVPAIRRAAPGTLPGQAPKERIRELVEDDRRAAAGAKPTGDLVIEEPESLEEDGEGTGEGAGEGKASGRASDKEL